MDTGRIKDDILTLTDLRANLTERIDGLARGSDCLVVTRNGRAAAVILSPDRYDELRYESYVRGKIAAGLDDVATGQSHAHESVMAEARAKADATADAD